MTNIHQPRAHKRIPITFFSTLRKEPEMNQSELIIKTAQVSGLPRKDIEHALKVAGDVITQALQDEGEATLPGLGKLVATEKPARTGRNPKTGEPVEIPARKSIKFRIAKQLKDSVK